MKPNPNKAASEAAIYTVAMMRRNLHGLQAMLHVLDDSPEVEELMVLEERVRGPVSALEQFAERIRKDT